VRAATSELRNRQVWPSPARERSRKGSRPRDRKSSGRTGHDRKTGPRHLPWCARCRDVSRRVNDLWRARWSARSRGWANLSRPGSTPRLRLRKLTARVWLVEPEDAAFDGVQGRIRFEQSFVDLPAVVEQRTQGALRQPPRRGSACAPQPPACGR
jgi:hypothetical protein